MRPVQQGTVLCEQMGVGGAWRLRVSRGGEDGAVRRRRSRGLSCHLLIGRQLQGCQETYKQKREGRLAQRHCSVALFFCFVFYICFDVMHLEGSGIAFFKQSLSRLIVVTLLN